jgi:threonine dehydrogenase-like Zn-dependent dehydrogenase
MRALVLHGFGDLRVVQRERPEPAPDEVLVSTIATGICGSDLHGFTGENGRRQPGQIMGHETAARIVEVGASVDGGLQAGQLVTVNPVIACGRCPACRARAEQHCATKRLIGVDPSLVSMFAEYVAVPARNLVRLADDLPAELGALVEPLAVAYHALRRGGLAADDRLLVLGGGPIGQSVIVAAGHTGSPSVMVSEPDPGRRALCERLGAVALDPKAAPLAEQLAGLGGPATVAVDAVGSSASLGDALEATVPGGRVVMVGMASPQLDLAAYRVSVDERTVIGSYTYPAHEFAEMAAYVSSAPPAVGELISERVTLDGAQRAFEQLTNGAPVPGKVLITF